MRNSKKLQIEQLDRKLNVFKGAENVIVPDKGWINSIRTGLNMTLEQLGTKLGITRQGAKKIEESETSGTISIKSLNEVAKVLELKLVYALIPKDGSLQNLIDARAESLAKRIVLTTSQHMKLENQGNSNQQLERAIRDLTDELKREMHKSLWD